MTAPAHTHTTTAAEVLAEHSSTRRREYMVTCVDCGALIGSGPDRDADALRRHQADELARAGLLAKDDPC